MKTSRLFYVIGGGMMGIAHMTPGQNALGLAILGFGILVVATLFDVNGY